MNIQLPAQGWVPRFYQLPLVNYMMQERRGLRAVYAWHRRAGKDLTSINLLGMKSLQRKGLYLYVGPFNNQIRRIIWNGQDGSGKKFIDYIPRELVERKLEQEMSIHLKTGQVIQLLGADDPDKLVGINPVGVVFSEFSLCDPVAWQLTQPILAENGGWAMFNGTPRGKNHFYHLLNRAKQNPDWFSSHLSVKDTRAITPEDLRSARKELNNESKFQSEYMCSFEVPIEGAYYGDILRRITERGQIADEFAADPALPVHTAWDLGMDDSTTIWLFQRYGPDFRICAYMEHSGEGLPFYAALLEKWATMNLVSFGQHYLPHDVSVREIGTGRSRIETLHRLGIRATPVKKLAKEDQIEAVRNILPRCWFSKKHTEKGLEHLKGYRKEWDEMNQVYKKRPVHDQCSHGADAFATLAVGIRDVSKHSASERQKASRYLDTEIEL